MIKDKIISSEFTVVFLPLFGEGTGVVCQPLKKNSHCRDDDTREEMCREGGGGGEGG